MSGMPRMKGMCFSREGLKGVAWEGRGTYCQRNHHLEAQWANMQTRAGLRVGGTSMKELPHSGEASTGDKSKPRRLGLWFWRPASLQLEH